MGSKVFKYIRDEEERRAHNIELIASENFVSDNVLKAVGSCLTNKYSKGYKEEDFVKVAQTIDGIINKGGATNNDRRNGSNVGLFYFAVLYNRGFYFRSNSALHSQTHNQEE